MVDDASCRVTNENLLEVPDGHERQTFGNLLARRVSQPRDLREQIPGALDRSGDQLREE